MRFWSKMILSFLYPQFNIDEYIPPEYRNIDIFLSFCHFYTQFEILERSILFFCLNSFTKKSMNKSAGMSH